MQRITAELALTLQEAAAGLAPLDRALRIASAVSGAAVEAVADWPIDRRDRVLIAARAAAFGRHAGVMKDCPACGARAEAEVDLAALLAAPETDPWLDWNGRRLALRAPSSRAIAAAAVSGADVSSDCCDEIVPADALEASLLAARPLLDVRLAIDCPECGHGFAPRFDITACIWADIEAAAARLLDDIHALALAYHWSEAAILALGPARRAAYLDRIAA